MCVRNVGVFWKVGKVRLCRRKCLIVLGFLIFSFSVVVCSLLSCWMVGSRLCCLS